MLECNNDVEWGEGLRLGLGGRELWRLMLVEVRLVGVVQMEIKREDVRGVGERVGGGRESL
jgi:hypothetical protein